jgi:hypothetical protein
MGDLPGNYVYLALLMVFISLFALVLHPLVIIYSFLHFISFWTFILNLFTHFVDIYVIFWYFMLPYENHYSRYTSNNY